MGMKLVPFYGSNDTSGVNDNSIKISPIVINNLGVKTQIVEKRVLHSDIHTVGYVELNENNIVHIHPRVEGWIEKLYVKANGDKVRKGEKLYNIYSPEMVNAQEEFILALQRKSSRLISASKNRLESLLFPKLAIKNLQKTRKVQQTVSFYSPKDGYINKLNIREGFYVKPGTTMMSIASLEDIWINTEVFESQVAKLETGLKVNMQLSYFPNKEYKGYIDYIYPTLDRKNRTVKVRLSFKNKDELLKPGMFANVTIFENEAEETLAIPIQSLIRTGQSNRAVLAFDNGRFKSVNVKIGKITDDYVQILEGLIEGDKVVTSAQFLIDSESSKTSDFKRMVLTEDERKNENRVWADAKIIKIMQDDSAIKVKHAPIEEWKWPEMTMNFEVDESIDFSKFNIDMKMKIQIEKTPDDDYIIRDVKIQNNKVWADAKIVKIMKVDNAIKVTHSPIKEWKWPEMTMNFDVDEKLDFSSLTVDMKMKIEIEKTEDGSYIITDIQKR
jgi:Cu(I)/Ag(I) efflux system membrane fusion protein